MGLCRIDLEAGSAVHVRIRACGNTEWLCERCVKPVFALLTLPGCFLILISVFIIFEAIQRV
jgi:hypothetical protein